MTQLNKLVSLDVDIGSAAGLASFSLPQSITVPAWVAFVSGLPTEDPMKPGRYWNNAGIVQQSAAATLVVKDIYPNALSPAMSAFLDNLPTQDPMGLNTAWNNAGVICLSAAGTLPITYYGEPITERAWDLWMTGIYVVTDALPDIPNIWCNDAGIAVRT